MLISAHVLVGTALGRELARRTAPGVEGSAWQLPAGVALATAVGVASHFACDTVPHWGAVAGGDVHDPEFLRVAVPDGLVGLGLLSALVLGEHGVSRWLVAACAVGACLPDTDKVGRFLIGRSPFPARLDQWHGDIQRESAKLLGTDACLIGIGSLLLLRSRGRSSSPRRRRRPAS